jgi:HEAT repeat protein
MEKRAKVKAELTETYQLLILDALDGKVMSTDEFKKFRKICKNRFRKAVLIDQIIDVGLMLPKDMLGKLRKFYIDLGLLKETKRKLYSRFWHKKIKAMKELSHLEIKDYNDKILEYVNAKNNTLRMEAQIAMVRLSDDENPFMFLEHLDHEFSTWEQITLHEMMLEANIEPPDFTKWLVSDNHDVGMFCLRMVREYQQTEHVDELKNMLYHPNEEVARFAIEIAGDLKLNALTGDLKKLYKDETYQNSLEIVKSLGKIGDSKTIRFLQHVVDSEADTQLQIEGVKAIRACGDDGQIALQKMLDSDYKDYKIIIRHVLDNRIN